MEVKTPDNISNMEVKTPNKRSNMEIKTSDITQSMEIKTSPVIHNDEMETSDIRPNMEMKTSDRRFKKSSKKKPRSYFCPFCDRVDTHKGNMRHHIRSHTDERPYKCSLCDKAYRKSSALKEHQGRVHLGEKLQEAGVNNLKFKCEICSKAFCSKNSFDRHLRSHFNEYVFKCNLCDKKFRHDSTFNRHKKTFHQPADQMNKCDICNKTLKGCKSDLRKHIKTHLKKTNNMLHPKNKLAKVQKTAVKEHDVENAPSLEHGQFLTKIAENEVGTELTNNKKYSPKALDTEHACTSVEFQMDESAVFDSSDSNDFDSDTEDEASMCIESN